MMILDSNNACYTPECTSGLFHPLGTMPANNLYVCKNAMGDGMRMHAYLPYEPMPTIRFSYNVLNVLDCTTERAGRIGIMPPFTLGIPPNPPTVLYPVSRIGWTTDGAPANFQAADVFLVATCDAKDLLLATNNKDSRIKFLTTPTETPGTQFERMTILNNGNVGINTFAPSHKLHVLSSIGAGIGTSISTPNPTLEGALTLYPGNTGTWYHIDNRGSGGMHFSGGGTRGSEEIMCLQAYGARLWLGARTATTGSPLLPAIDGKLTISEDATSSTGGYAAYASPILFRVERRNNTSSTAYKLISAGDNANETFVVWSNGKVEIGSGTSGTAGRRIPSSPNNDCKFSVDGKAVAREILVTNTSSWADYVFSENYKLPSLTDVETYIQANKHLPGIPTTQEVEENGIALGEIQGKLLEKIEQLTLYMIEMKKQNDILSREVEILKQAQKK
jgi:hypothetical protein